MSPPEQRHNNINNTNHGTTDLQATKRRCIYENKKYNNQINNGTRKKIKETLSIKNRQGNDSIIKQVKDTSLVTKNDRSTNRHHGIAVNITTTTNQADEVSFNNQSSSSSLCVMEAPNTQIENKVSENITDINNAHAILEVIGSTVVTPRTMESTITSNSTNYKNWHDEHGGLITVESKKQQVRIYTRENLFKKVKFITADKELDYIGKFSP